MAVFAPSGSAPLSTIALQGSQSPLIANIIVVAADTEMTYVLPPSTKKFLIKTRGFTSSLRLAYSPGASNTVFLTIPPGTFYGESDLTLATGMNLYFQTTQPSQLVEIVSWA